MKNLIHDFPKQLEEGLAITNTIALELTSTIQNVIIIGLGGSGIGGEIMKNLTADFSLVPIEVCHSYHLPYYVGKNTLVITCSYSGNTEETLNALNDAITKKAQIVGITSGGKLEQILRTHKYPVVKIPGGLPPRAALAYPLTQIAGILEKAEILTKKIRPQLNSALLYLTENQHLAVKEAKLIAKLIENKTVLFYAEDKLKPLLLRGCQQLNENGKELAYSNVIPELNHNEIVGWAGRSEDFCPIIIRHNFEFDRNAKRLDLTAELVNKATTDNYTLQARGNSFIDQAIYTIHVLDWLSFFIAEQKQVDVMEVNVIDNLKMALNEQG